MQVLCCLLAVCDAFVQQDQANVVYHHHLEKSYPFQNERVENSTDCVKMKEIQKEEQNHNLSMANSVASPDEQHRQEDRC